jgi:hypothetical protein
MTVRTRNWAAGIGMGLKSMVGGELKWFTNMVRGFPTPGADFNVGSKFAGHHI